MACTWLLLGIFLIIDLYMCYRCHYLLHMCVLPSYVKRALGVKMPSEFPSFSLFTFFITVLFDLARHNYYSDDIYHDW